MIRKVMKVGRTSILVVTLLLSTMTGAFATSSTDSAGESSLNSTNNPNQPDPNPNQPDPNPNRPDPNPNQPDPIPNQPAPVPNNPKPNPTPISANIKSEVSFLVDGQPVSLGTVTDSVVDGQTVTTVSLNSEMVDSVLAAGVNNDVIAIPVNTDSDVVVVGLHGAAVTALGEQRVSLDVMTSFASYNVPMRSINMDDIIIQFGPTVKPEDVTLEIIMAQPTAKVMAGISNTIANLGGEMVGSPVSFEVGAFTTNAVAFLEQRAPTIPLNNFNEYIERRWPSVAASPSGTSNPAGGITVAGLPVSTMVGGVLEPDGSVRPVPLRYDDEFRPDGGTLQADGSILYPAPPKGKADKAEAEERRLAAAQAMFDGGTVRPDGSILMPPSKDPVDKTGKGSVTLSSKTNSTYVVFTKSVTFDDVKSHWAKDTINEMGSRMIVSGTADGKFNPNQQATRAEFADFMVRGLGLKLEKGNTKFSDIKATDKYNDVIKTANAHGLINGFEDGTFRPNDKITREQAMTIMSVAMDMTGLKNTLPAQKANEKLGSFTDATTISKWAKKGVTESLQAGIFSGKTSTQLAPKEFITRAEVAVIIKRLLQNSKLI
ncbi:S-layer homology domain-containing protein [Paenibacillus sp. CMAA1364]